MNTYKKWNLFKLWRIYTLLHITQLAKLQFTNFDRFTASINYAFWQEFTAFILYFAAPLH